MDRPIAPYVIPFTGELIPPADVVITAKGVAYADPIQDALRRDLDNVLWAVCGGESTGSPEYAADLHPDRQRTAMEQLRCAVCKKLGARDDRGMAWVLPLLDDTQATAWEGVRTVIPPMCEHCVETAPRRCPRLRAGHVELRAQEAEQVGVRGTLYPRPGEDGEPDPDAVVLYESPDLPFVIARQVVRELRSITVVTFAAALPD
ncbi:hypothetical protein [Streptomyces sp. NPDC055036]